MLVGLLHVIILILIVNQIIIYFPDGSERWRKVSLTEWRTKRALLQEQQPTRKKKIALVCYDNRLENPRIEKLKKRNQSYCIAHNYEFLFFAKHNGDDYLPPYWLKVKIVKEVLESNKYDLVMWIDSDACFNDFSVSLDNLFQVFGLERHFFICGPDKCLASFNAGVWIVKNKPEAKQFMSEWLAQFPPHRWSRKKNGRWKCPGIWAGSDYEQGAGRALLLSQKWNKAVIWMDEPIIQSPGITKDGFIFHFSGPCSKPGIDKLT